MSSGKTIEIKLISTQNGFYDFDVTNAGTIRRVTVPDTVKFGEMFNIYYGDGSYVPHSKEGATWQGRKGIAEDLTGDVLKSIKASAVFIGESKDSSMFYKKVAAKHCECCCAEPSLVSDVQRTRCVIAVDLETPDYSRDESRNIIYLSECSKCHLSVTHGTGIGSFNTTGLDKLKELAEKAAGCPIDFDEIITSI